MSFNNSNNNTLYIVYTRLENIILRHNMPVISTHSKINDQIDVDQLYGNSCATLSPHGDPTTLPPHGDPTTPPSQLYQNITSLICFLAQIEAFGIYKKPPYIRFCAEENASLHFSNCSGLQYAKSLHCKSFQVK